MSSGSFKYKRADTGTDANMFSPPSDVCLPLDGGAVELANGTDATMFLYADVSCSGGYDIVGVGAIWSANVAPARGVRLGSTA